MNQFQIEQMAGIKTKDVAEYIMKGSTQAAKNAMSLLVMQCKFYEPAGMTMLQEAVKTCKKELKLLIDCEEIT